MNRAARGWLLGGVAVALTAGALALTVMALAHVQQRPPEQRVAPVPTFSQPPAPAPSDPEPTPALLTSQDRSLERFIVAEPGVVWRGTAGACGAAQPTLERSNDDGQTWTDVTPVYLGIGQLLGVAGFAGTEAEIIASVGEGCEVQLLRTFTQGSFWGSYPNELATAAYVDPADAGRVIRAGIALDAPCDDARGLQRSAATLAVVCAGTAYLLDGEEWRALPVPDVAALAFDGEDVLLAHVAETCIGLALTRVSADGSEADSGCAAVTAPSDSAALAVSSDSTLLWSDDEWINLPR